MQNRKFSIVIILLGSICMLALIPGTQRRLVFNTPEELEYFRTHTRAIPIDSSIIFPTATVCKGCHGYDTLKHAMVTSDGMDVNIYDDWRASMMANSAKDPFWRAKVSHEVLVNPGHSRELQTKCTSCHAPQGHYTAILRGAEHYLIEELLQDSTGLDGVSCASCHSMAEEGLASLFSGKINYDTNRVMYGPYEKPFLGPMEEFVGFTPLYSKHINDAGICASCHTLITESVDLEGQPTGESFVEQATYHEWLNSVYDDHDKVTQPVTCQGCHMPRLEEEIVISSNYLFLEGRQPYGLHGLIGGNSMMLKLMKENREQLGIDAEASHFDETIDKTLALLRDKTIDLSLELKELDPDSAYFTVLLKNKAGHKFPSGYPSRRAFVEFTALTEFGDTLFQSGVMNSTFEIVGQGDEIEPHYDLINEEGQVQIYEMVPVDVEGNFTTLLERAYQTVKDNRLVPVGFTKSHPAYDTTRIVGFALTDPNFNSVNGLEGSGTDLVRFHIALDGYTGLIDIRTRVYYQSLPPRWMAEMFAESTPEIDMFREMYYSADLSPVLIAEDSIVNLVIEPNTGIQHLHEIGIRIYPNPALEGMIYLLNPAGVKINKVHCYDTFGRLISTSNNPGRGILLPDAPGIYILAFETGSGNFIERVVR